MNHHPYTRRELLRRCGMGFGAPGRENPYVEPGTYTVKLAIGGQEHETKLTLRKDPNAEWQ